MDDFPELTDERLLSLIFKSRGQAQTIFEEASNVRPYYNPATLERGMQLRVTNKTGAASAKGQLWIAGSTRLSGAVSTAASLRAMVIVAESGIPDGRLTWCWLPGSVCKALLQNSTAATPGNLVSASSSAPSRVNCTYTGVSAVDLAFYGIGYCLETVSAGTDQTSLIFFSHLTPHQHDNLKYLESIGGSLVPTVEVLSDLYIDEEIYSARWAGYAGSTITGWTSPTATINYYRLGDLVVVGFEITGTSNSTAASFTLPWAAANTTTEFSAAIRYTDNGTASTSPGQLRMNANSATVNLYTNFNGGSWTNSGSKIVRGSFTFLRKTP